jgi:membrane-associated phospholipid phosphatase
MKHRLLWSRTVSIIVWLLCIGAVGGSISVFGELAEDVWFKEGFAWDRPLMLAIHTAASPGLDILMQVVTATAGNLAYLLAAGLAAWFWRRARKCDAVVLLLSVAGSGLISSVLKLIFARPRPSIFPPVAVERTYSFPSGHTMTAVALYGVLAVLLWQQRQRIWAVSSAAWVPVIALSRVYLGAHYPSDVLAALAVGVLWLFVIVFEYRHHCHVVTEQPPYQDDGRWPESEPD